MSSGFRALMIRGVRSGRTKKTVRQAEGVLVSLFRHAVTALAFSIFRKRYDVNRQTVAAAFNMVNAMRAVAAETIEDTRVPGGRPPYRLRMSSGADRACSVPDIYWSSSTVSLSGEPRQSRRPFIRRSAHAQL